MSKSELGGPLWCAPYRGVHRPAGIEASHPAGAVADAIALMTPGCALGGWAARWLQGGAYCDGLGLDDRPRDVLIHCGPGAEIRPRRGIRPTGARVLPGELLDLDVCSVATIARAAYDEMRRAGTPSEALVALEMAVSTTTGQARTSFENVQQLVSRHVKTRGIVKARWALHRASTRSASPWETRLRCFAVADVGLGGWLVNAPVFDLQGGLLGIPDLLDATTGLVLESDGAGHRDERTHTEDNVREEAFERAGLVVVRVGARDHGRRRATAARIRKAHRDAQRTAARGWTVEKPDWWWTWPPGRRWD